MNDLDSVTIEYLRRNDIFADVINFALYNGEEVVKEENLKELDAREISAIYDYEKGELRTIQRTRDVIKVVTMVENGIKTYKIIGIESQSYIDKKMPLRSLVYDMLRYLDQEDKKNKSSKSDVLPSKDMDEDCLFAVSTVIVFFSSKKWKGPLSFHDMFYRKDEKYLAGVLDFHVTIIEPKMLLDEDFDKFRSSMKQVLLLVKYDNDKDKMEQLLNADEAYQHMRRQEINLLNMLLDMDIPNIEGKEDNSMCVAVQLMKEEARQEGRQEERVSSLSTSIKNLMETMGWSMEKAMDALRISMDDRKVLSKLIN